MRDRRNGATNGRLGPVSGIRSTRHRPGNSLHREERGAEVDVLIGFVLALVVVAGTAWLRDVRTGDEEEFRDRLFSASTRRSALVCVRLLGDGQGKQLCDGGFDVAVGAQTSRQGSSPGPLRPLDLQQCPTRLADHRLQVCCLPVDEEPGPCSGPRSTAV